MAKGIGEGTNLFLFPGNPQTAQTNGTNSQDGDAGSQAVAQPIQKDEKAAPQPKVDAEKPAIQPKADGVGSAPKPKAGEETPAEKPKSDTPKSTTPDTPNTATSDIKKLQDQVASIQKALQAENSDFSLVLGIASLLLNSGITDYENQSNVLHAATLGRATPQLLTGVAFRAPYSNFHKYRSAKYATECPKDQQGTKKPGPVQQEAIDDAWRCKPFSGFVSLKFAPGTSQTLSGYVIGEPMRLVII